MLILILLAVLGANAAQAAVSLSHSRLILSAANTEATPSVSNDGSRPVLLQMWVDAGEREADLQRLSVPFVLTPPVLRLEAGGAKRLRLMYTGRGAMPQDRESVFWLNILEIPPKAQHSAASMNQLQLTFRTRVKVFFRPAGLQMPEGSAHEKLIFELRRQGRNGMLRITNPTAIHQTLLEVNIGIDEKQAIAVVQQPEDMVAPHASIELPLTFDSAAPETAARVFFSVINDYGGVVHAEQAIGGWQ